MENKQLAENINELCKRKGITVNKLSKDLNLSSGYISEMKNKDRTPSIKRVLEIADYLEVSIDYLVGREPIKPNSIKNSNVANTGGNNTINVSENKRVSKFIEIALEQMEQMEEDKQLEVINYIYKIKKEN